MGNPTEGRASTKRRGPIVTPRILIIEPYDDIRKLVEMTLRHVGQEVISVGDGSSAIDAMEREYFSCVVVGSPVTVTAEGRRFMLLEYIEEHCPERRPCIVVITTWVESEWVLRTAQRLDVCAVFAKPFSASDLAAVVRECLAGRRPARRWYGIPDALIPGPGAEVRT